MNLIQKFAKTKP